MAEQGPEGTDTSVDLNNTEAVGDAVLAGDTEAPPGDAPEPEVPKSALEKELEKIKTSSPDFNQWVTLEKMTEAEKNIEVIRQVYDSLLAEYPLCYGYWKKYADAEHKHGDPQLATQVFLRGIAAVPYSVDLWGHFCTYKQKNAAPAADVRKTFEDGIAYVGTDYLAHGLWDKYIKFETEHGTPSSIVELYKRILECPLKELDRYYSSLETFAAKHQAPELIPQSLIDELRQIMFIARQKQQTSAVQANNSNADNAAPNGVASNTEQEGSGDVEMADATKVEEGVPLETVADGEDAKPEVANEEAAIIDPASITEQEIKAYWLSQLESVYEETKKEVRRRRPFDSVIKRPYFHVKPLPAVQLHAWNAYIDYILTKEDPGLIVRLFERCLVACATYPEFWMRFVRYTESTDPANALAIVQRAVVLFCKNDLTLNLFAAQCHERAGDIAGARSLYKRAAKELAPKLVSVILQAASFERRHTNLAGARKYFEDLLEPEETSDSAEGSQSDKAGEDKAILAVFYGRFLFADCQLPDQARVVFEKALTKHASLRFVWEAAIHFEEHCFDFKRTGRVIDLYKRAIAALKDAKTANEVDLETLSQQMLDYADRLASPSEAETLRAEHFDKYNQYKEGASSKRSIEGSGNTPNAKRAKTVVHTAQGGPLPGPPQGQVAAYPVANQYPVATQPAVVADPYAAQAYPATSAAYGYDQYYQQYPQQAQQTYAGYQYGYQ